MLKHILKAVSREKIFLLTYFLAFISLQFVFDIKSLLLVVFIFLLLCTYLFRFSLRKTLFYIIILSFSFDKGIRGWNMTVVPRGDEQWMSGFTIYYGLSIRSIVITTLFLLSLPKLFLMFKKNLSSRTHQILFLLVLFIIISFLSTINSSDYFLSFFGFLRLLQSVFLFFITLTILESEMNLKQLLSSLSLLLLFNAYISVQQYFAGGPLGLFLEDALGYQNLGFFTTDGAQRLYRSSGLIGHPTFFASFLSMLFSTTFGFFLHLTSKPSRSNVHFLLAAIAMFMGIIGIYATFSRSAWVAIIVIAVFLLAKHLNKGRVVLLYVFGSLLFSILIFGKTLFSRFSSILYFFSQGSGVVRIALLEQACIMIQRFPVFGVGLNLSPRMMLEQSILPPNLRGFVFPVHNTFFLFFSELGIPAGLLFILLFVLVLVYSFEYIKNNYILIGVWMGVIAFIINAQFHTLFNQDPSFDLVFMFLGILTFVCIKKNKLH